MPQLENLGLIPLPMHCQPRKGRFPIDSNTHLILASDQITAEQIRAILANISVVSAPVPVPAHSILLTSDHADHDLGGEGYSLEIEPAAVTLRATASSGFLHGLQTLGQMLTAEPSASIPCCIICDRPRFSWRGMHLDVSRHFFPSEQIHRFLELLALHKFNTFHWHLTDDQGWRIEINKWPRLTSVGAWRGEDRYGGFYRQEEILDIVSHAARLGITIVPEIELPGHCQAAIAAYPWLGNTDTQLSVRTTFDASPHVYSVSDRTLAFLQDCLHEVIELFPGPFIHIGGDECSKDEWRSSPEAQAKIRSQGLRNEEDLQAWFTNQIGAFLDRHGRRMIGWDEIHKDGLPVDASIMIWRGEEHALSAVRAGHDVVMTPTSHCYFDYYQGDRAHEPVAFDGDLLLATVYDFEPIPGSLNPTEAGHVLGSQGNLWTEHIADWEQLMYMAFPRACALAEVLWSPKERRNYRDFQARWQQHAHRLDHLGVNYRAVSRH